MITHTRILIIIYEKKCYENITHVEYLENFIKK